MLISKFCIKKSELMVGVDRYFRLIHKLFILIFEFESLHVTSKHMHAHTNAPTHNLR